MGTKYINFTLHQKKGCYLKKVTPYILIKNYHYFFGLASDDTDNLFLPFARLLAKTLRPFAEAILSLNPCLFLFFLFDGWYVLLLISVYLKNLLLIVVLPLRQVLKALAKIQLVLALTNQILIFFIFFLKV